jgi:hypothetical protein
VDTDSQAVAAVYTRWPAVGAVASTVVVVVAASTAAVVVAAASTAVAVVVVDTAAVVVDTAKRTLAEERFTETAGDFASRFSCYSHPVSVGLGEGQPLAPKGCSLFFSWKRQQRMVCPESPRQYRDG